MSDGPGGGCRLGTKSCTIRGAWLTFAEAGAAIRSSGPGVSVDNTVKVTINGREYQVAKGSLLIEAAKSVGIEIPVFCYHPKMKPVGACRMCLVEV
jgi:hypothetical protein